MPAFATNQFTGGMNDWIHPGLIDEKTARLLVDAEITNGKISAVRMPERLALSDPVLFGHWGTRDRSVVKWYERFYWSNNEANIAPYYGGNVESLGVPYPEAQPALDEESPGSETGLTGDFKYCMCYVNDNGWEGAPGSLTSYFTEISVENKFIRITAPATFPDGVSYAKIYRTTGKGADFFCVGEIDAAGGFLIDKTEDITLTMLEPLTSENNYPPPDKGKYLTESGGVFFLAVGSRVYFSVQNNPHAWTTLNFVGIDNTVRGIASEFQGVLVFTDNNTFRITGADDSLTVTKFPVPGDQGCVNYRTIAHVSNAPVWLSNDGICLWNGESLTVISNRIIKTERLQVRYAVSANDTYYLFLINGAIIFDRRNGNVFRKLAFSCDYAWYDGKVDRLFLQRGSELYEYGTGTAGKFQYQSPYAGGGELALKTFVELAVACSAGFSMKFFVDGRETFALQVPTGGRKRIKIPFSTVGRHAQVHLESGGELSEIAILYG